MIGAELEKLADDDSPSVIAVVKKVLINPTLEEPEEEDYAGEMGDEGYDDGLRKD